VVYARLRPDLAIVVDTFPAAGTPDTRHLAYTARIGQGALITPASGAGEAGFLLPRAARDAMIAAAQHAGVPYQLVVTGGGMTDAAAALTLVEELVLHPPTVEGLSFLKDVEHS
jgi:putative aminopeptidase FrvX